MKPELEERMKRLELIKKKYKKGVPKPIIDEFADKCAKEFLKENGVFYDRRRNKQKI